MRYTQSQKTHLENVLKLQSRAVLPTATPEKVRGYKKHARQRTTQDEISSQLMG
jgi:hypothetical protein